MPGTVHARRRALEAPVLPADFRGCATFYASSYPSAQHDLLR